MERRTLRLRRPWGLALRPLEQRSNKSWSSFVMSSHPTTIRAAAAPTVEDCGAARTTRALAESMMQYCQRQSDAKVLRTIQAFPALANDKSLLLDLILKEYKLRQNDQSTPIVEFCQQFQFLGDSMEQSILRALEVQKYLDEHPELLGFI